MTWIHYYSTPASSVTYKCFSMADLKADGSLERADDEASSRKAITDHIEAETRKYLEAINARNYDINSPTWTSLHSAFTFDSWITDRAPSQGAHNWFAMLQRIADAHPEYQIRIQDMSVTLNDFKTKAEVFMNVETKDMPLGVVRQAVTILTWKPKDRKWFCTSRRTFHGTDGING